MLPGPGKIEIKETAEGYERLQLRMFGIFGGAPIKGWRPASTKARTQSSLGVRVATLPSPSLDLSLAASNNDVKYCHSVLPHGNRGTALIGMARRLAKTGKA